MNRNAMTSWWRNHVTLRTLYLLFLGQLASFTFAISSFTSSFIASLGVDAPVSQFAVTFLWLWSMEVYFCTGAIVFRLLGIVNKAYQFSSITSVTLLDGSIIAWAIIFTWLFLGTQYSLWQLFAAAICMLGLGVLLLSDARLTGGGCSSPILGDILVIAGTIFYAMSNVGEEFFVKKEDRVEVVCMIGVNGLLILGFAGYAASSFTFYSLAPFVLKLSGATMFNPSLLTADMWAVVFRICFYHQQVDWLYFLAFAIVVIGLVIYSVTEKDPIPITTQENQNDDIQYQVLDNGNLASGNESLDS